MSLSKDDVRQLVSEYEAGAAQEDLATRFGLSQSGISRALKAAGAVRPPRFDVALLGQLYEAGETLEALGERFGAPAPAIWRYLKKEGVEMRHRRDYSAYDLNRHFFAEEGLVQAYWAGFLAADGCVTGSSGAQNTIACNLQLRDEPHLRNFRAATGATHPISTFQGRNLRSGAPGNFYASLRICCYEWAYDLQRVYNVIPRKSLTLQPPEGLKNEESKWAFARGYFDGNGSVRGKEKVTGLSIATGSPYLIDWLARRLFKTHHTVRSVKDSQGFTCAITGENFRRIVPLLYAGSTPETRLERKYLRFCQPGAPLHEAAIAARAPSA